MAVPTEQLSAELDRYLAEMTQQGWEIVNRSPTTAQIKRRGGGGLGCGIVLFFLLPLLAGFLFHYFFYGVAMVGLIVVVIGAALRKDELRYIGEHDLIERLLTRTAKAKSS